MKHLAHIFLSLTCLVAQAQTPVFRLRETKELGNVHITTVFQDSKGWIWFGAKDGVYRYDGLAFQLVGLPDSLSHSPLTALFEWGGRVWAGFQNGAIGYLPVDRVLLLPSLDEPVSKKNESTSLQLWQPEEGLPRQKIAAFAADHTGGFWIATYGEGLYCLKNNRLYQFNKADDGLSDDGIYALACDAKGRIWAATDAGISICTMPAPGQKQVQHLTTADGLPDEIITALLADNEGNMWVGTEGKGVCHYDVAQQKIDFQTPDWQFGMVLKMAAFGSGELWAGTSENGLVCIETATRTAHPLPAAHPLRGMEIPALCKDREGLLWAVCERGTVYSANVRFSLLQTPFDTVQAVLVDRRNRLWAGSPEGLFMLQNEGSPSGNPRFLKKKIPKTSIGGNTGFKKIFSKKENVIALWESPSDGNIWAGTFGNGVYVVSPEGRILRHLSERNGLNNGSILSIAGEGQRVWLATLGGVAAVDLRFEKVAHQRELGSSYVYKVFPDSRGRVWFGTFGNGLSVLENGSFRHFTKANGVELKTIYSIAEDLRGHIWFSTEKEGLFCFDGQNFRRFTTDNHLHSLSITGLAADANGQIVIAYEDGFDMLNPGRTDHVTFCDAAIGAPPAEVNLNALCRDAQGKVWLGTRKGIVRAAAFNEAFLDDPQPGITSVSVFSQAIDFLSNNIFPHDKNYFIFNFTGLWYTDPESVRYRYRLDNFDRYWKVSKDHLASYPNLSPGRYTFRVQTSEHGNFENVPEAAWTFTIKQPVWTQWWFVALCLAAVGGLFYTYVGARERRLKREAGLKREKVESQFAALKSQINPHFLFNSFNTLITIIEENPKIAVEYVEHLSDFYRSIIAYRERDFISLQEEMDLVRSFDFLLKKRYEEGFRLLDRLNGQTGLIMPLALQMLVENAVKHNIISAAKPLTVEIFAENDDYVVVRNNIQPKIKPEPSTHFGLQSLVNRYQLLGERPVVVEDNAAFFTVKVPIKNTTT